MSDTPATQFRVLPWPDALAAYGKAWENLVRRHRLNASCLPGWQSLLVDSHSRPEDVRVLVQLAGEELAGIMPFHTRRDTVNSVSVTVLEPICSVLGYHTELVSAGDPAKLLDGWLNQVDGEPWHMLRLNGMLDDTPTSIAIEAVCTAAGHSVIRNVGEVSPYLVFDKSWDELVAERPKKKRYQMRKRAKDFAQLTNASYRWLNTPETVDELLAAMMKIEEGSWKQASGVAIASDPREVRYQKALLAWLADRGALRALVLFSGSRPVAFDLFALWDGWAGNLKGSFDSEFSVISPGNICLDIAMEELAGEGVREMDFLGYAEDYKLSWTKTTREHSDWFVFRRGTRGQLLGIAKKLRGKLAGGKIAPEDA